MILSPEPLARALEADDSSRKVLFSAAGDPMTQASFDRWADLESIAFVCGRYEGVDQRVVDSMIDEEVSMGDFVILGGEAVALAAIEGVVRLLPGVVGNPESLLTESFRDGTLEEPQYTRPASWRGMEVPEVLQSGDHARIEEWRRRQRQIRTAERRPDLVTGD